MVSFTRKVNVNPSLGIRGDVIDATDYNAHSAAIEDATPGLGQIVVGGEDGPEKQSLTTVLGEAIAADETVVAAAAAAAETAVDAELVGRDVLEGGDFIPDYNDQIFAVVDDGDRRTWLEIAPDGGLTSYAADKIGEHIVGTVEQNDELSGLSFAVVDEDDRLTWLQADQAGQPTAAALQMIADGIGGAIAAAETVFPSDDWAHWGDSLTAAGSGDWPAVLAGLTGRNHYNGGWGGQATPSIAARQGGVPARVTLSGDLIPAVSAAVAITSITRHPLSPGGSRLVSIAGVGGTLARDGGGAVTFTRSADGDAVATGALEYVTPLDGSTRRDRIVTLWTGRNDFLARTPLAIVADIRQMIDYLSPTVRRVVVMEIPPATSETTGTANRIALDAANAAIQAAFPEYWLDIAAWLRTTAAATAAGITFTSGDNADIASGIIPGSFMSDTVHHNSAGWTAIADRVYLEAQNRGWL